MSMAMTFERCRRTGPLDRCERLALERFQATYPRPMLAREAIEPSAGGTAADFNLGCLRLQARGWIRTRRSVSWELTRRIAEGGGIPEAKPRSKSVPPDAEGEGRRVPSEMTAADVVLVLGRALLQQPTRSDEDIARDPGPFLCLLSLAEAGGFEQTDALFRAIARVDMVRAYWLAAAAASSIHPVAVCAVLKHHRLDGILPALPKRAHRGQR